MHLFDLETGERRLAALDDVAVAARLCDALPDIDFVMSGAYPDSGSNPGSVPPGQFRAMIEATTKPLVMTAGGVDTVEPMWRMACEVRGGAEELRAKPYFVMYNQPVEPAQAPLRDRRQAAVLRRPGDPRSTYCPSPIAGGTAPITTAGQVTLGIAEALFGLVMHQLRAPGATFVIGQGPNTLDMATAQNLLYNSPEFVRAYACEVEMAKWLDLPNWGFSGHTDAQVIDAQAGMEADELTKLSMQLGSNLNHDVGYLDFGLTGSLAGARHGRRVHRPRPLVCWPTSRCRPRPWPWTCWSRSAPAAIFWVSATPRATCATASGGRRCSTAPATIAGSRPAAST